MLTEIENLVRCEDWDEGNIEQTTLTRSSTGIGSTQVDVEPILEMLGIEIPNEVQIEARAIALPDGRVKVVVRVVREES